MYSTYEEEANPTHLTVTKSWSSAAARTVRSGYRIRLLLRTRLTGAARNGYETIMVNCNPETVSTDYDLPTASTSSR